MPFDQEKKRGFFGSEAYWTEGSVIFGAQND